jgi:hypothetical protein
VESKTLLLKWSSRRRNTIKSPSIRCYIEGIGPVGWLAVGHNSRQYFEQHRTVQIGTIQEYSFVLIDGIFGPVGWLAVSHDPRQYFEQHRTYTVQTDTIAHVPVQDNYMCIGRWGG